MASKPSASGRSRPQSDAMSQWIVGSKIGKGSFASVYSGTHKVSALAPSVVACVLVYPPKVTALLVLVVAGFWVIVSHFARSPSCTKAVWDESKLTFRVPHRVPAPLSQSNPSNWGSSRARSRITSIPRSRFLRNCVILISLPSTNASRRQPIST